MKMNHIVAGIFILILGIFLFPFGIMYFKQTWAEYRELTSTRKKLFVLIEIIDMFTSPILSTWVLLISLVLILLGIALIFFVK